MLWVDRLFRYRHFKISNATLLLKSWPLLTEDGLPLNALFITSDYASSSNSTHPFCLFAIESRRGAMTRDDSFGKNAPGHRDVI